jgi:hypothetical protein
MRFSIPFLRIALMGAALCALPGIAGAQLMMRTPIGMMRPAAGMMLPPLGLAVGAYGGAYGGGYGGGSGNGYGMGSQYSISAQGVDRGPDKAPLFGYGASPYAYTWSGKPNDDVVMQQANLLREEVYRSQSATRQRIFDERLYIARNTPTYEQLRQEALQTRYSQALNGPPLSAVWSGATLNDLVSMIRDSETASGGRGPTVEVDPQAIERINWTANGDTTGLGMIRNGGRNLTWPTLLTGDAYARDRQQLAGLIDEAVQGVRAASPNAVKAIGQASAMVGQLREELRGQVTDLDPQLYLDAQAFLRRLGDSLTALREPTASRVLQAKVQAATVADLVDQISAKGLRIAAAAPGDESAYSSLYNALSTYQRGLARQGGDKKGKEVASANRFD